MERVMSKKFANLLVIAITAVALMICLSITANAATTYVEKESNNTFGTANKISLGKGNIVKGTKKKDNDEDYFYFNNNTPCKLKFLVEESEGKEIGFSFYDTNRKKIDHYVMGSNAEPCTILLDSRAKYMCVDFPLGHFGTYSVIFDEYTRINDDISEPNETFSHAKSVSLDQTYHGILNHYNSPWDGYDQIDYVKYDLPAGKYCIKVNGNCNLRDFHAINMKMYNYDREELLNEFNHDECFEIKKSFYWEGGLIYVSIEETHDSNDEYSLYLTQVPNKNKITKLRAGKKMFTVNWTMEPYDGYYIRYSRYSSMKNAKTIDINDYSTTSKTVRGLKSKKKYYVQVKPYKYMDNEVYFAAWSSKKSIKTK